MTIKIILADDHQIVRQGLRSLLAGEPDMEVVGEADNGRETLKLVEQLAPDVVIMDISMPDLNGIEATRQLLAESTAVKVIALSMHSDSLFVLNMLRSGALGYLLKDCALEELVKAIRTVMRSQTYISPGVSDLLIQDLANSCVAEPSSAYSVFTPREREVLHFLVEGQGTPQIAAHLGVSNKTIETHRKQIMNKLGLNSVAELTKYAIRQGLASLDE
ncbi:MAG: response regulator transcription factor [Deltaproteobacteria bacterium]|nr:response regulator transcription factor [Deltaproteobacteria bacterium]